MKGFTLMEGQPRHSWLAWDNPHPDVLAKFGDRYLTWTVSKEFLNKQRLPTNTWSAEIFWRNWHWNV